MKALARMPERRYQSARELQMDLEGFARNQKLEVSSAALAEWMEAAFGPKREIWHTLPLPPSDSNDDSAKPSGEQTAATKMVAHAELGPPEGDPMSRPRARAQRTLLATAIGLLTILLVGGAAFALALWLARARIRREPLRRRETRRCCSWPKTAASPSSRAPRRPGPWSLRSRPPRARAGRSRARRAGGPGRVLPPRPRGRARNARSGPEALSAAVAGRLAEIRRCFAESDAPAASAGEISLRFEVGVDGAARSVAVLPAAVGETPLGACLAKVGRATTFAPQPAPVTFRIPVTVQARRRGRRGGDG